MRRRWNGAAAIRAVIVGLGVLVATGPGIVSAQESRTEEGVGLTIYSEPSGGQNPYGRRSSSGVPGWAVVKEWRKISLKEGRNEHRFRDVAAHIDGTTVHFTSLTDPDGTYVLEQSFEYDLVSPDRILSKYIDLPIALLPKEGAPIRGKLLSHTGTHLVVDVEGTDDPIQILSRSEYPSLQFPSLPGGLITKPTLVWLLDARQAGEHLARVTYQTKEISWLTDYTLVTDENDENLDVSAWVTITNQSGASYEDAEIKLVAGDVHRAPPTPAIVERLGRKARGAELGAAGFEEKAFFEYHLYTLQRKSTVPDRSTKQIELFQPVSGVPVRKILLYYGGVGGWSYGGSPFFDRNFGIGSNRKVDVYLEFRNGEKEGLGVPFPAGRVRVYKKDPDDGSLEFIGEDRIDHTPKDEKVLLKLGSAFDVVGERKQTDFKLDMDHHVLEETFEIRLRNHKEEDVEVVVKENLYRWVNWKIEESSHDYEKQDARTVHFPVKVKKDGETVLTYTVKYTW